MVDLPSRTTLFLRTSTRTRRTTTSATEWVPAHLRDMRILVSPLVLVPARLGVTRSVVTISVPLTTRTPMKLLEPAHHTAGPTTMLLQSVPALLTAEVQRVSVPALPTAGVLAVLVLAHLTAGLAVPLPGLRSKFSSGLHCPPVLMRYRQGFPTLQALPLLSLLRVEYNRVSHCRKVLPIFIPFLPMSHT